MAKLEFRDDILAPHEEISIDYGGKNPFLIFTIILNILRDILKISSANLREDIIRWYTTDGEKFFYGVWRAFRGEDRWTKTWIKVIAQGTHDREHVGNVNIRIRGWLHTKFSYRTPFERWLWWLWNYFFYWKQRRAYLDFSRNNIMQIREEIMAAYKILPEEVGEKKI